MKAPFLIIGGYGTVGSMVSSILRKFQPDLPIALGGRSAKKANEAAQLCKNAVGFAIDTSREDLGLPVDQKFSGIAVLTNDLSTNPARYAMEHGIPYTSIATQLTHIGPKLALHINNSSRSVSLIQDTSFAGTLVLFGIHLATRFSSISEIRVGAVMDDADMGGPAALSDGDDYAEMPAGLILIDGVWKRPQPAQEKRNFKLLDGSIYEGASFPSIDIAEIVAKTNAASARLDFILAPSPQRLAGGSPSVEIIFEIDGKKNNGEYVLLKAQLTHPLGQSYLTAIGVAVAIETLVGKVGTAPTNGIYLPSNLIDPEHMVKRLTEMGTIIDISEISASD
ncbi:hypothetical protein ACLBWZ_16110 [Brucellaceae bacterium C25G]